MVFDRRCRVSSDDLGVHESGNDILPPEFEAHLTGESGGPDHGDQVVELGFLVFELLSCDFEIRVCFDEEA